jgi:hypothetical protein
MHKHNTATAPILAVSGEKPKNWFSVQQALQKEKQHKML